MPGETMSTLACNGSGSEKENICFRGSYAHSLYILGGLLEGREPVSSWKHYAVF